MDFETAMKATTLPKLSVVLPNYNHAACLPNWFKAVYGQSLQPYEIIIIDDASTDNSVEVLEQYSRNHPEVRIFHNEKNQGVGYGVNRGLDLATGDYIYFSASDDEILPGFFEKSMRLLAEYPQAALSCTVSEWHYVSTSLHWHMAAGMAERPCYLSPDDLVRLGRRGKLGIVSQSAIMHKQALREAGGFRADLRWHCDTYVGGFRHGVCFVPEPLSLVSIHPKSYFQAGHKSPEHRRVLLRLLELLNSGECADVAPRIRESGALSLFGLPMLRLLWSHREYRRFLTPLLTWRSLRRSVELIGKELLPPPLARVCLRLFYHHRGRANPAKQTPAGDSIHHSI
jgi:glycosyltransferase involved in cell wall biosynthesis